MILAAQDVGHLHERVIDRIREEKGRRAVFPPDDKITDVRAIDPLRAMHQIIELQLPIGRHAKPQRRPIARGQARGASIGRERRAGARIARRPAGRELSPAAQFQFCAAAKAWIGLPLLFKARQQRRIDAATLGLPIGSVSPAAPGTLVPLQSQPCQVALQSQNMRGRGAKRVRVFHAQYKSPARAPRQQHAEQRRADVPKMEFARRAGRKAGHDGGDHSSVQWYGIRWPARTAGAHNR